MKKSVDENCESITRILTPSHVQIIYEYILGLGAVASRSRDSVVIQFVPPGFTVVIATLSVSVLVLVFGEIVPKSYGLGHAESWSLRVARPISDVERILRPLVTVFDIITRWLTTLIGGDQHIEKPYLDD